jgi:hypothetical protein
VCVLSGGRVEIYCLEPKGESSSGGEGWVERTNRERSSRAKPSEAEASGLVGKQGPRRR